MSDIKSTTSVSGRIAKCAVYCIMIFFTVMAVYPLFWLLMSSLKTTQEYQLTSKLSFPKAWWFENYSGAWVRGKFELLFLNSILYTGISTAAIVLLSSSAGFALAKLQNKASKYIYASFVIGMLITLQCIMVPLFILTCKTGLYDTHLGILICYTGIGLPLGIYLSTEFIKSIPDSIIESARIDGATFFKIFRSIIFQMIKPVAVTITILTASSTWNEFMLINILASSETVKSLPVGIQKFSGALAADYGKQFAALVIGMIPMLVFYLFFRKQITKGVVAGAVKG